MKTARTGRRNEQTQGYRRILQHSALRNQQEKEAKNHDQSKNLTNTTNLTHLSLLGHSTHNSTMHTFVLNDRDHLSGYIIRIIFWATNPNKDGDLLSGYIISIISWARNSNKNKRIKLIKSNQSTWFYVHNQPRSFMWV